MQKTNQEISIIDCLFNAFCDIRYVAVYSNKKLVSKQRKSILNTSSEQTDKFEELLVNPTLLTLASQRGNIDCGGLNYIIVGYGNFYQLIKATSSGHISICLSKNSDLNSLPNDIFDFLEKNYSQKILSISSNTKYA